MQPFALSAYDYDLPDTAIAKAPASPRGSARLLVLPRAGACQHRRVREMADCFRAGDLMVTNTTRVIPARLWLRRASGGRVECLLLAPKGDTVTAARAWTVLLRNARAVRDGEVLYSAHAAALRVCRGEGGELSLWGETPLFAVMLTDGEVPLPPYIRKQRGEPSSRQADAEDYQSVFAAEPGAVAAPTASLHFTEGLLAELASRGVQRADVCLHVGAGTFLPVRPEHADDVRQHRMHRESYAVPEATQAAVRRALAEGRRVVPVGTTSLRALETWASTGAALGQSDLFLHPGVPLRVASALLTNFHVPRSTLLMLVAALATRERTLDAYREALRQNYRFLSYGDAMWVDGPPPTQEISS